MTFKYPIEIARDLARDISILSLQSMEVHGIGLVSSAFRSAGCVYLKLTLVYRSKSYSTLRAP
jgi:hypothetical protein